MPAGSGPRAGRELASPSSSREVSGFISEHKRSEVRHCGPSLSPFAADLLEQVEIRKGSSTCLRHPHGGSFLL